MIYSYFTFTNDFNILSLILLVSNIKALSSSRISLIKDIIKSKTSPKVILIIHIHLGGDGINFHQSNTAQILERRRGIR
ncbi:MAG: hypothetical protein ACO2PO_21605 [Candidatus Calescibacterium sp.]